MNRKPKKSKSQKRIPHKNKTRNSKPFSKIESLFGIKLPPEVVKATLL